MANEDKKVLITGASGGLGRACAVEAAKAGYYVICHYNGSKEKAEETMRLVQEAGGKGELIQFNVSDRADCKAKLEELTARLAANGDILQPELIHHRSSVECSQEVCVLFRNIHFRLRNGNVQHQIF